MRGDRCNNLRRLWKGPYLFLDFLWLLKQLVAAFRESFKRRFIFLFFLLFVIISAVHLAQWRLRNVHCSRRVSAIEGLQFHTTHLLGQLVCESCTTYLRWLAYLRLLGKKLFEIRLLRAMGNVRRLLIFVKSAALPIQNLQLFLSLLRVFLRELVEVLLRMRPCLSACPAPHMFVDFVPVFTVDLECL